MAVDPNQVDGCMTISRLVRSKKTKEILETIVEKQFPIQDQSPQNNHIQIIGKIANHEDGSEIFSGMDDFYVQFTSWPSKPRSRASGLDGSQARAQEAEVKPKDARRTANYLRRLGYKGLKRFWGILLWRYDEPSIISGNDLQVIGQGLRFLFTNDSLNHFEAAVALVLQNCIDTGYEGIELVLEALHLRRWKRRKETGLDLYHKTIEGQLTRIYDALGITRDLSLVVMRQDNPEGLRTWAIMDIDSGIIGESFTMNFRQTTRRLDLRAPEVPNIIYTLRYKDSAQ